MEEMFKKLIADALQEAIQPRAQVATTREIMTREQLADYLQVSVAWVDKNVKSIPHLTGIGGTRFRKSDIDTWLDSKLVMEQQVHTTKVNVRQAKNDTTYRVV